MRRRPKYTAAEDDLLRVEQADEVRHRHAPELNGLGHDLLGNRIAAVVSRKHVSRGSEGRSDGVVEWWSGGNSAGGTLRECLVCNFGQPLARGMVFETAAGHILTPEGTIQSQPTDGSGDKIGRAH